MSLKSEALEQLKSVSKGKSFSFCPSKGERVVPRSSRLKVYYEGEMVGYFNSDIIVANTVILELKSVKLIHDEHKAQLLNYLKLTGLKVGYLLNFGTLSMQFRRLVM